MSNFDSAYYDSLSNAYVNVVADMYLDPRYPDAIEITLSADVNPALFSDVTAEQDEAICAAMNRAARALETEIATILNYDGPVKEED